MKNSLRSTSIVRVLNVFVFVLLFTLISCSDGMNIGQEIDSIIKENGIETLTISTGEAESIEIQVEEINIENQFLKSEGIYINLGSIKSLKINGNKLEVNM